MFDGIIDQSVYRSGRLIENDIVRKEDDRIEKILSRILQREGEQIERIHVVGFHHTENLGRIFALIAVSGIFNHIEENEILRIFGFHFQFTRNDLGTHRNHIGGSYGLLRREGIVQSQLAGLLGTGRQRKLAGRKPDSRFGQRLERVARLLVVSLEHFGRIDQRHLARRP